MTDDVTAPLDLPPVIDDVARPAAARLARLASTADQVTFEGSIERVGVVQEVGDGVAAVTTIPGTRFGEVLAHGMPGGTALRKAAVQEAAAPARHCEPLRGVLRFSGGVHGIVFDLGRELTGCVLLGADQGLKAGDLVRRTGEIVRVPVGRDLVGRVVNPLGEPLDGGDRPDAEAFEPIEQPAPAIFDRAPVTRPLQTGIKSVDAMIPVGRGQRELIVGDRSTGKTAIGLDTIINQRGGDVLCIYCGIGQRTSSTAGVLAALRRHDAMAYTIAVIAAADDPPGLVFAAPYAATTIAEFFCRQGRDVLIVYDDLTKHAQAYRQVSLLLRRPPGREAYPGDIFYIHARLLERSTQLNEEAGGGSLTALPIVETQAGNISAYIPTNLISITDGQIFVSSDLFSHGFKPAVDIGRSVSRVGGQAQRPAMRKIAGPLRLGYTQFEELEIFTRFGARVEEATRVKIERGRRIRQVLNQPRFQPLPLAHQVIVLLAVSEGLADDVPLDEIPHLEEVLRREVPERLPKVIGKIDAGDELTDADRTALLKAMSEIVAATFGAPEKEAVDGQGTANATPDGDRD